MHALDPRQDTMFAFDDNRLYFAGQEYASRDYSTLPSEYWGYASSSCSSHFAPKPSRSWSNVSAPALESFPRSVHSYDASLRSTDLQQPPLYDPSMDMWSSSHWSDSDASSDSSIQSWDNGGLNSIDECDTKPDIYYTLGSCSPLSTISSPSPSPSPVQDLSTSTPKSERKPRTSGCNKMCFHCHATSTPLWRREPSTLRTLCNACGLYLQQRNKLRPQELIDADNDDESENSEQDGTDGPECSHCHTRNTSVWRRSKTGAQLCNACGVYARLRGKERPLSLKRNKIKPRTKHAKTPTD